MVTFDRQKGFSRVALPKEARLGGGGCAIKTL